MLTCTYLFVHLSISTLYLPITTYFENIPVFTNQFCCFRMLFYFMNSMKNSILKNRLVPWRNKNSRNILSSEVDLYEESVSTEPGYWLLSLNMLDDDTVRR